MMEEPRILSIQSHVVSGYVGNKSAVFPMQLLGFDVDFINSVQFSNHTGYPTVQGQVITEKELKDLISGLKNNEIDTYSHLLTGYIGSAGFLKEIESVYQDLKLKNENLIFVCDPVLGDNGELYVPQELLPIYKEQIIPNATILVPNLFETELLTDTKISNEQDLWHAINLLHEKGVETVCVSSAEFPICEEQLCIFASCAKKDNCIKLQMQIPKIPRNFTGTGDLFSALLLCFMYKTNSDLKTSLENTVAALQAVLKRTYEFSQDKEINAKNKELRLIQSRDDILDPKIEFRATIIE